ncbi:hypothetical protein IWW55_005451, partial [Coemansia sp. RSA 2706]
RVLGPIIEQAFGHLWGTAAQKQRPELASKCTWLIAYATQCADGLPDSVSTDKVQQLVGQMKEVREELPARPIQTHVYGILPKILEWINTPILARIVLLWVRDVTTYDNFTYYSTYFTSSEVPVLFLLLEEIAYRQPLLKPLVFAAYKDSFESRVPDFPPEKQIKLQKMVINRIAVLAQLDYVLPVLNYFDAKKELIDESVIVYFLCRLLAQFDAPYPTEFYTPVLGLLQHAIDGVKVAKEKGVMCVRDFLARVDDDQARALGAMLVDDATGSPISID